MGIFSSPKRKSTQASKIARAKRRLIKAVKIAEGKKELQTLRAKLDKLR